MRPQPITSDDVPAPSVDLLGVRFPRIDMDAAVEQMIAWMSASAGVAVAFPDMSTMNLVSRQPGFLRMLREGTVTFNDGAGLALAARLRRRPFPANLNGTDLCPALFERCPPGTRVALVGGRPGVADRAGVVLAQRFPHLDLVLTHHGYLDADGEAEVADRLRDTRPQVVMVGMGNPLQVEYIDRHRELPGLAQILWLAVGGQLDYYGGDLPRAPGWMRRARLEWLHLVRVQPHKLRRYAIGIPAFLARVVVASIRGTHDAPSRLRPGAAGAA
ncbi:MAG: WecB/TagA/CpsF family glycosyltransferase [Desertimonas sp.]